MIPESAGTAVLWHCPLCNSPLNLQQRSLRCDNGHCFDLAKEGYVNLLPAQHKKSKQPGDNQQMIASRRLFLEAGFYQPLSDGINQLCQSLLADRESKADRAESKKQTLKLLDCGCGEGYYTRRLQQAMAGRLSVAGLDISKFAVRAAAKAAARTAPESQFAVASSFRLPVADDSVDLILRVFAPGDEQEAARVLKDDGYLLIVSPGEQHLQQLKQQIYPEAKTHTEPETAPGFELAERRQVRFELTLPSQAAIEQLLMMTPFYWQIPEPARQRAAALESLTTEADFILSLYRKC